MVNINKTPVTSSFEAALMADGAVVAFGMRDRALVKDANTTWGSLAWSPPA